MMNTRREHGFEDDDGLDDDFVGSVDDEGCLSPTQAQFVFRRERTESGSEVGPRMGLVSGLEAFAPTTHPVPEETTDQLVDEAFDALSFTVQPRRTLGPPPGFELAEPPPSKPRSPMPPPNPKVVLVKSEAGVGGSPKVGFDAPERKGRVLLDSGSRKGTPSPSPSRSSTPTTARPRYTGRNSMPTPRAPRILKREPGAKEHLNLVVIGHVDAGKSTLMGHLLLLLGHVNQRTMHKYRTEATKQGKGSFAYAWVLDESKEERDRGVTMDIARSAFETPTKKVTLLDAPGHKDFIPNMITGATQADAAVLVVNAGRGEFETGFMTGGQTREHAMLARSLGVSELIVAVNKLDSVDWSQSRYEEVVETLRGFLKGAGYPRPHFLPLSGLNGDNLHARPPPDHPLAAWYQGPCLMELIDGLHSVSRDTDKETRISVSDIYKGLTGGVTVTGKVETGSVEAGDKLLAQPAGEWVTVKSVEGEGRSDGVSWAGSEVILSLTSPSMSDASIVPGSVLVSVDCPLVPGTRFRANVLTFPATSPLTPGFPVVLHAHNLQENATIARLVSLLHKTSGEILQKRPRSVCKGSRAVVELATERPVCLEPYTTNKELGRLTLRSQGNTIAAGVVLKVLQ